MIWPRNWGREFVRASDISRSAMAGRTTDAAARRTSVLARQLAQELRPDSFMQPSPCLAYQPPEFHSGT